MHSLSEKQKKHEESAVLSSDILYEGRIISLRSDKIKGFSGAVHTYDIVTHPGAVVILPVDQHKKIHLVKQWRRAAKEILIELPAGTLEENENPIYCAQRELQEEIGYKAHKITPLGGFYTAPGFCNEYLYFFLAEELEKSYLEADDTEFIDHVTMTVEEAMLSIENHEIKDAKTICGIYRYYIHSQLKK